MSAVDPEVLALAREFISRVKSGRAVRALEAIILNGSVTTEDLKAVLDHPPRAIADVRDNGIPIITESVRSSKGRRIASYRLGTAAQIRVGQTGRTNFSRKFRNSLLSIYGAKDAGGKEPRFMSMKE